MQKYNNEVWDESVIAMLQLYLNEKKMPYGPLGHPELHSLHWHSMKHLGRQCSVTDIKRGMLEVFKRMNNPVYAGIVTWAGDDIRKMFAGDYFIVLSELINKEK